MTRARRLSWSACALGIVALGSGCMPDGYDGLTGGEHPISEDAALHAPRPLAPISVSMVATSRPRFRFELAQTTGAMVEMCKKRDCAGEAPLRFTANGQEIVVDRDLEPGIWFWRLRGYTEKDGVRTVGTDVSPTWEVLVRGPAKFGASDAASGSVLDLDGDGNPDLLASVLGPGDDGTSAWFPWIAAYVAAPDGTFPSDPTIGATWSGAGDDWFTSPEAAREPSIGIGGGTDFNGDGFADFTTVGMDAMPTPDGPLFAVMAEFGSPKGWATDEGFVLDVSNSIYPGCFPTARESGDVNGDGYGDVAVGADDAGYAVLGSQLGPASNTVLFPAFVSETGARPVIGAFDADGDGRSELAVATPSFTASDRHGADSNGARIDGMPKGIGVTTTDATRRGKGGPEAAFVARWGGASPASTFQSLEPRDPKASTEPAARAFATGDFNGDGLADIAASSGGRVCFWFGDREHLVVDGPCSTGMAGDLDVGSSLAAGDLEGDGVDELLVIVKSGDAHAVRTMRVDGDSVAVAEVAGTAGVGASLTTIWPGRPGKARWAAAQDDGRTIAVFEGSTRIAALPRPQGAGPKFGVALR